MQRFFTQFDVLLAPISPIAAFAHDQRPFRRRTLNCSDGHEIAYLEMLKWKRSGPAGGIQIIGPHGGDVLTLAVAQAIDEQIGGFRAPPLR
jgi:amidase